MSRAVDWICPPRMGSRFRWLLASSWISNLGDGIALAAGPLLVASQTRDPVAVAAAAVLQRLPWLLFSVYAGVVADRLNRRRVVIVGNLARTFVLVVLTMSVATDSVSIAVVLVAMFLLGTTEVFVDTTTETLLPMMVDPADIGVANSRLMFGALTLNRMAGPPIGALLFAAGMFSPFAAQAVTVALGALLIGRIALTQPPAQAQRPAVWHDIRDGARWLWQHPPIRTLTLTAITFNVTFGAAWSVLVLYAIERLRMGEVGFGLLTTAGAVGGVAGTIIYGRLERTIGPANIMRAGLIIETATHLTLAITRTPIVALVVFTVFGVHEASWGTTATSIRQRAVPLEYQGRVGGVYFTGVVAGLVVGSIVGGVVASIWGVTGPFWFAFVGSALILTAMWRQLGHIVHGEL
ncbi:MAG: MFS transporter [Actinomycetota bacterium]|nr:MFS transporter [Actinomycetota bacterium]